ncbi:hypothetical protein D7W79_41410 [Corallococcus exercitus]|nr:hypothetical protein D7W79_41410 [Corallococcus exercitus]
MLLLGPPGAGKTQILERLKHEYRVRPEPFEVRSPRTPAEMRELLSQRGGFFIAVEDPWGAFQLSAGSDQWHKELPQLLKSASSDKKVVVTTREAILQDVSEEGARPFQGFAVSVTYEDYDFDARRLILLNKLKGAQHWQRELATAFEARILDALDAPISLERFVEQLKELQAYEEFDLEGMLDACAVGHLASCFVDETRKLFGGETIPAAIAFWGLLSLSNGLTIQEKRLAAWKMLGSRSSQGPIRWAKLVDWMTAGRWLSRDGAYYLRDPLI